MVEELVGLAISALQHTIAEVKRRWSVIVWVTKYLLSSNPPCFGRHVKLLVLAAFAIISTHSRVLTSGTRPVVKIIAESL
jgi:hypothetical protein